MTGQIHVDSTEYVFVAQTSGFALFYIMQAVALVAADTTLDATLHVSMNKQNTLWHRLHIPIMKI